MAENRYPRSEEWRASALRVTPGASQTRSKRVCGGAYPAALVTGAGATVWDVDGHEYLDWVCALGAVGLGYAHPEVNKAARVQLAQGGVSFSLPNRIEGDYAEEFLAALRWPEMLRFVKTGSEATEGAMMIARRATGRRLIYSVGYHGWHEAHQEGPDLMQVERLDELELHAEAAAVIVEPMRNDPPDIGALERLRVRCTALGIVLIFDECITGFRWALGGAGEYCGITPDLACFGKAMANGFPLAAIVGPRALMEHAIPTVSSTFGGEAVSLAAARATLRVYQREPVIETMWKIGAELQAGLGCGGSPVRPVIEPCETGFLEETAARGVLLHPAGCNVSYAHTMRDVERTVEACR